MNYLVFGAVPDGFEMIGGESERRCIRVRGSKNLFKLAGNLPTCEDFDLPVRGVYQGSEKVLANHLPGSRFEMRQFAREGFRVSGNVATAHLDAILGDPLYASELRV